jgi:hypothetical protein
LFDDLVKAKSQKLGHDEEVANSEMTACRSSSTGAPLNADWVWAAGLSAGCPLRTASPPSRSTMNFVTRTILQRLCFGLVTLFVLSVVIFSAKAMLPGDFAKAMLA